MVPCEWAASWWRPIPKVPSYRSDLGNTLAQTATLLRQEGQLPESRRFGTEAIEMQRAALALNPVSPVYRRMLRSHYGELADTLVRMSDLAAAADTAEKMPPLVPKLPDAYFRAARLLCRCSTSAHQSKQPEAARDFADRAMAVLQKAKTNALKNADGLRKENFKVLQQRDDYQKLLAELEQKKPKD